MKKACRNGASAGRRRSGGTEGGQALSPELQRRGERGQGGAQHKHARPEISIQLDNFDAYGTLFIGYPSWGDTMHMPCFTLLERYDMGGRTVVPFTTHEDSRFGRSLRDLQRLCPRAKILDGRGARLTDRQGSEGRGRLAPHYRHDAVEPTGGASMKTTFVFFAVILTTVFCEERIFSGWRKRQAPRKEYP